MAKIKKIYFFIGTTAELIKLAPVISELKKRKLEYKIISSNQNTLHFEQLKPILGEQKADYTFKMKKFTKVKDVYIRFIWWVIKSFGNYLLYFWNEFRRFKKEEVVIIVHGDTISAVIGAIIAKLCRVKIVHVESGLRSFSFLEPFPEEISRYIISWTANYHFCPNDWAINNLKFRPGKKINTQGNTISESIKIAVKSKRKRIIKGKYFVLVVHRQEHTLFDKENSKKIINLILSKADKNMKCVFIMHSLTLDYLKKQKMLGKIKKNKNIILPDRLPFVDFINLLNNSEFVATDGGSNQEECYYLGKPCLILRNRTERIEGLRENAVLAKGNKKIIQAFLKNYKKYSKVKVNPKNSPSKIIVDELSNQQ